MILYANSRFFLSRFAEKHSSQVVGEVCRRFIQVFRDHGVEASQIPRLFPHINLSDLQYSSKLLAALNPKMLDQVARLFGVRVEWLEGVDDQIYEYLACYKRPATLLEHLDSLLMKKVDGDRAYFDLRILCTTKKLDRRSSSSQLLAPVLVEKIAELGEETICRYHVYRDGFDWSHYPSRIELKAIARIVFCRLGIPVSLFEISKGDMDETLEGRLIPYRALNRCLISSPSLEDYGLISEESCVAKETEELPEVLKYIDEQGLDGFLFKSQKQASDVAVNVADSESPASDWREIARNIANEIHKRDVSSGAHDSLKGISDRVATEMRKRNHHGARGPVSAGTVLREALQGGKWKRDQSKEKKEIRE